MHYNYVVTLNWVGKPTQFFFEEIEENAVRLAQAQFHKFRSEAVDRNDPYFEPKIVVFGPQVRFSEPDGAVPRP